MKMEFRHGVINILNISIYNSMSLREACRGDDRGKKIGGIVSKG